MLNFKVGDYAIASADQEGNPNPLVPGKAYKISLTDQGGLYKIEGSDSWYAEVRFTGLARDAEQCFGEPPVGKLAWAYTDAAGRTQRTSFTTLSDLLVHLRNKGHLAEGGFKFFRYEPVPQHFVATRELRFKPNNTVEGA